MQESRMWVLVGGASLIGGLIIAAIPLALHGIRPDDNLMLSIDLAGAFIIIASSAGYLAGRVMQMIQTGGNSAGYRVVGMILAVLGIIPVVAAAIRSRQTVIPTPNHIWLGAMGATLLLIGIFSLLAHRIVLKASTRHKPAEKEAAAAAHA